MFITVKNTNSEDLIINSNTIKNISVNAGLSEMDSNGVNSVTFKICVKDFNDNIYYTPSYSCKNYINYDATYIRELILYIIEQILNSDRNLKKSFIEEVRDDLFLELNFKKHK